MTGTLPSRVSLDSTTLSAAVYDGRRGELQLDFRDGARYARESPLSSFATCSVLLPRASSLIDTFEAASLMPNYRRKTKWHWADSLPYVR